MVDFGRLGQGPILVLGRAGMDIYAEPPGTRVEDASSFFACLGGSAGNIAAGLARMGLRTGLISAVSDDAVGLFVRAELSRYGVDDSAVATVGGEARTSLAVTETHVAPQTVIYRNGAADLALDPGQLTEIDWATSGGLIVTGTALASEPSRGVARAAMALAREAGAPVILDIDYRPYSWASAAEAASVCRAAAEASDAVIGNDEEFDVLAAGPGGHALAQALAEGGRVAIYKRGAEGSDTFVGHERFQSGIFAVSALKPMGAGDAFMAGTVAAIASGTDWPKAVRRGSAAAAMVVSGKGCAPAMPDPQALDAFIAAHPSPPA